MATTAVIGTQWGDEGKGKIVDNLAEQAQVVVRYQGGNNAGHTVVVKGVEFKLNLLPAGILYPGKTCVIGNGVVVDPAHLLKEINGMRSKGIDVSGLKVSNRAHLIMPYHRLLDAANEEQLGDRKIGTTKRGIGPCYVDKCARVGIRMVDLMDAEEFAVKLKQALEEKNKVLSLIFGQPELDYDAMLKEYLGYAEQLRPFVTDTLVTLHDAINNGDKILFEGAQATMLDLDYGTYPYVTSSHPLAGGISIGSGVGPRSVGKIIGVVKAYTTRVGEGPFVSELTDEIGDMIRDRGHEYGTTTGRPRRCGWLDTVVVKYACMLSSIDCLAITRLDILDTLKTIKICSGYLYEGKPLKEYPASLKMLDKVQPVYEELPGWETDITGVRRYEDLPLNARRYVERLSELAGVRLGIVSVGPGREQTIVMEPMF
jgi:adenylosuccinate synthase